MKRIPKGKVTTYGALADFLGTSAVRAVGTAVGKNPEAPKIPCHRVVRADGVIGNYSGPGGTKGKIKILQEEGLDIVDGKVRNFGKFFYGFNK